MKQLRTLVVFVAILTCNGSPTLSCGFDELAQGICPQFEAESPLAPAPNGGDVGILDARYVWTKWPEFKGKDKIVLKVCMFRAPTQTLSSSTVTTRDFSKGKAGFERVGARVERAANAWTSAKGVVGGVPYESALEFDFRGNDGKIQACDDLSDSDWHIAIAIGTASNDFYVGHGFKFLEKSREERRATMLLYDLGTMGAAANAKHEFGHALGFTHEMVHRDWAPCVNAFLPEKYAARTKIDESRARNNVNNLIASFSGVQVDQTDSIDKNSIMTYAFVKGDFDKSLLTNGEACLFERNTELSDDDVVLYLRNYGRPIAE
jgi:hypothetical protein